MTETPPDGSQVEQFARACQEALEKRDAIDARAWLRELKEDAALVAEARRALTDDLKRVLDHPANPYAGTSASRQRYRQLGHFPESVVEFLFGNHAEFQRAAGLRDLRNTTRSRNKGARLHTELQIAEHAREHVLPHVGKHDWVRDRKSGHLDVMVASDIHSGYCDPFARRVWLDALRVVSPEVVIVNGDLIDFPEISRHPKFPGHFHLTLQEDIDAGAKFLRDTREAAPQATIYYVLGNHDYRAVRYVADTAAPLASLRSLSFDALLGLDASEVSLVCRSNFLAPTKARRKRDIAENWVVIADCYAATHGSYTGPTAGKQEMARFGLSGTSGHVHDPSITFDRDLRGRRSWMVTPAMACVGAVGRDYVWGPHGWTCGFGLASVFVPQQAVSQQLVLVHESVSTFAGRTWTIKPDEQAAREAMTSV
jgi:hypothetical protein